MPSGKKKVFTGDSFPLAVDLKDDNDFDEIPLDAVVTVGFVANRRSRDLLAGPWTASAATPGANWTNGRVVVNVVGADTEGLDPQSVLVEVQVVVGSTRISYQTKSWASLTKASLP